MHRRTLLGTSTLIFVPPVFAHHGWSSFDQGRPIYVEGKVIKVEWRNPHAELDIELPPGLKLPPDLARRVLPAQTAPVDGPGLLARAVLPPQRVTDGVVTVRLIEARIDALKLRENRSTADAYITRRMAVAQGELVALDRLRDSLVDFNLRNDLSLRAELAPGSSFGTTDIVLIAQEPPRWEATLGVDNAGTESVGEARVALNVVARSLSGYRDRLIAAGMFTEGSRTGSVLFDLPVSRRGTRAGVGFDASEIEIVNGPLAEADVAVPRAP